MGRMPCCEKAGLKKGPWTPEEDQRLTDYIQKHGPGNWRALPKQAGLERCGKSCRLRWTNYLRPDIKRGKFSSDEEEYIIQLHSVMGNKWSAIAAKLPGRTDNEIKNYWNTHIRKRLLRMGIDPVTHGPRLDLLDLPAILSTLQNPSLLNMPALLNMQSLLNPEILKLATSLASSQNGVHHGISQNLLNNPFVGNTLSQNQADLSSQFINQTQSQVRNIPSFDGAHREPNLTGNQSNICNVKTEQIGFQENGHVMAEPDFDWCAPDHESLYPSAYNSAFMSDNSNRSATSNSSGFSSVISSPCSSPANPLDGSFMYLNNSQSSKDDIESFLNNIILNKLENPVEIL